MNTKRLERFQTHQKGGWKVNTLGKLRFLQVLSLVASLILYLMLPVKTEAQNLPVTSVKGYAPVNGIKMYYEIHGNGEPILLLHGAYMTIEGPMRKLAEKLAADNRKVILTEFQGHGRTGDANRDITYENLADDAAALVRYLRMDSVDVIGYSMGGSVAIQLAIRHPKVIKKLVSISGSISDEGFQPSFKPMLAHVTPAAFEGSTFKKEYNTLSPHPEKFPVLVEKLTKLDLTPFNWEKNYVKIKQPLFLIIGDFDVVTLSHASNMFTGLGGNVFGDVQPKLPPVRLAVLPYTTHVGVMSKLSSLTPMITEFITEKQGE